MNISKDISRKLKEFDNGEFFKHIEKVVLPQYEDECEEGCGVEHILDVLKRAFDLIENLKLDLNLKMVTALVVYHNIGKKTDGGLHSKNSAQMFLTDTQMHSFFTQQEGEIIAHAIEDHSTPVNEPRNDYGKLISSADRQMRLDKPFTISYQLMREKNPDFSPMEVAYECFNKLNEKFGENGYASKVWFDDGAYERYIGNLRLLLNDFNCFCSQFFLMNGINISQLG